MNRYRITTYRIDIWSGSIEAWDDLYCGTLHPAWGGFISPCDETSYPIGVN